MLLDTQTAFRYLAQILWARGLVTQSAKLQSEYQNNNPLYRAYVSPLNFTAIQGQILSIDSFLIGSGLGNLLPLPPDSNLVYVGSLQYTCVPLNTPQDHRGVISLEIKVNNPGPVNSPGLVGSVSGGSNATVFNSSSLQNFLAWTTINNSAGGTAEYNLSASGILLIFPRL